MVNKKQNKCTNPPYFHVNVVICFEKSKLRNERGEQDRERVKEHEINKNKWERLPYGQIHKTARWFRTKEYKI